MNTNIDLTKLVLDIAKEEHDKLYDDYEKVIKAIKQYQQIKQKLITTITSKYKNKCKRRMGALD